MAIKKMQIVPPGSIDIHHPQTDSSIVYMADGTTTLQTAYNNLTSGTTVVGKANQLTTARTITLTGAVTGSVSFNGSANVSIPTTLVATANADTLDDQHGSYYLARANHTGTQASSTISDFALTVRGTLLAGLSLATNAVIATTDSVLSALGKLQKQITDNLATLTSHIVNKNNPHEVTKAQVNLTNVDDTADKDKPVSIAQQTALNLKANLDSPTFTGTPLAPTAVAGTSTTQIATTAYVKGELKLSNLGITVSAEKINFLSDVTSAIQAQIDGKAGTGHTHSYAGSSTAGGSATTALACTGNSATATKLFTARTINGVNFDGSANITITAEANGGTSASCSGNSATATKLATARTINGVAFDGTSNITITAVASGGNADTVGGFTVGKSVPSNAVFTDTVYTHPTSAGYVHIPSGGAANQYLRYSSSGVASWADPSTINAGQVDGKSVWVGDLGSKGTDANTIYFCY